MDYSNVSVKDLNTFLQKTLEKLFPLAFYLYNQGDECTDVTNGWNNSGYTYASYTISAFTKNASSIALPSSGGVGIIGTQKAVPLSNYTALCIETEIRSTSGEGTGIYANASKTITNATLIGRLSDLSGVQRFALSGVSDGYLMLQDYTSYNNTGAIKRIWVE